MIEHLLAHGTQGILVGGTTGEGPTLTIEEKLSLYTHTAATIAFTRQVSQIAGIEAALVVVPPYNKPDQAGMCAHFTAIAEQGGLPIIIYNIPGRVSVKMEVATILALAHNPKIIGIKQCGSEVELAAIIEGTPHDFLVYTGEDAQTLTTRVFGGQGVISVASHIFGSQMTQMETALQQGNLVAAAGLQRRLMPKMAALFSAPSPAPIKAALNAQHISVGTPRLPILPLTPDEQSRLLTKIS